MRTLRPLALPRLAVRFVAFFDTFFETFFVAFFVIFRAVGLRADFVFVRVVISQPRMQHVEVHLEATGLVSFEQSLAETEISLARLSFFTVFAIESFSDQVAELSVLKFAILKWRLGNQQG